jgi:hypothetical protein
MGLGFHDSSCSVLILPYNVGTLPSSTFLPPHSYSNLSQSNSDPYAKFYAARTAVDEVQQHCSWPKFGLVTAYKHQSPITHFFVVVTFRSPYKGCSITFFCLLSLLIRTGNQSPPFLDEQASLLFGLILALNPTHFKPEGGSTFTSESSRTLSTSTRCKNPRAE